MPIAGCIAEEEVGIVILRAGAPCERTGENDRYKCNQNLVQESRTQLVAMPATTFPSRSIVSNRLSGVEGAVASDDTLFQSRAYRFPDSLISTRLVCAILAAFPRLAQMDIGSPDRSTRVRGPTLVQFRGDRQPGPI
jgi:hypothetical protein